MFAHHPRAREFAPDTFVVRGVRFCVGCFTTYPTFLVATLAMALTWPFEPIATMVAGGLAAAAQALSSAGLARRRWQKVLVKSLLGAGMALLTRGTLDAPLAPATKTIILLGLIALSSLSALPRAMRMRSRGCTCETHARTRS